MTRKNHWHFNDSVWWNGKVDPFTSSGDDQRFFYGRIRHHGPRPWPRLTKAVQCRLARSRTRTAMRTHKATSAPPGKEQTVRKGSVADSNPDLNECRRCECFFSQFFFCFIFIFIVFFPSFIPLLLSMPSLFRCWQNSNNNTKLSFHKLIFISGVTYILKFLFHPKHYSRFTCSLWARLARFFFIFSRVVYNISLVVALACLMCAWVCLCKSFLIWFTSSIDDRCGGQ